MPVAEQQKAVESALLDGDINVLLVTLQSLHEEDKIRARKIGKPDFMHEEAERDYSEKLLEQKIEIEQCIQLFMY